MCNNWRPLLIGSALGTFLAVLLIRFLIDPIEIKVAKEDRERLFVLAERQDLEITELRESLVECRKVIKSME